MSVLLTTLILSGCTNFSAKQPYRAVDGEQMLISANMENGSLKLWVNDTMIVNEPFMNQDKSLAGAFSTSFTNVYNRNYKGKLVMARCSTKPNALSAPDMECDVFVNGEHAANLFLR